MKNLKNWPGLATAGFWNQIMNSQTNMINNFIIYTQF